MAKWASSVRGVLCLCAWALASAGLARATVFVPMTPEELAASSAAAITGVVSSVVSVEGRAGHIFTLVEIEVEDVLFGSVEGRTVVLKENGGKVGERREVIFGAPLYEVGEHVLVFLGTWPDGSLRTNHLALGKFRREGGPRGETLAGRRVGWGTLVLVPEGAKRPVSPQRAAAIVRAIEKVRGRVPRARVGAVPAEAADPALQRERVAPFQLLGPGRFFEPDVGEPLEFLIDARGDPTLGLAVARAAVGQALAVWSAVESASIELADGGLTSDLELASCQPPHKVIFDDPASEIPDPVGCAGTLAQGGFCDTNRESKVIGGVEFTRAKRAKLIFNNGFENCAVWNPCNLAEIATHEIGHAIGLDHSSENHNESDPALRDATMFFVAHFDGRCAALRADDEEGLRAIYPEPAPVAIVTPDPLPTGILGVPYSVTLVATGGAPPLTWSVLAGGFPGLDLDASGVLSGTPEAFGDSFLRIRATDAEGESHTKVFDITVLREATSPSPTLTATPPVPSPTPSRSRTPTPVQTPTPTASHLPTGATLTPTDTLGPTPVGRAGDANCDGSVNAVDLTALARKIPMNDIASCPAADAIRDGILDREDVAATVRAIFAE